jgi:hypothetical protein
VSRKILYFDGLHFVDAKDREQPLPPTAVVGFRSDSASVAKDRSLAANIDANRALISFKEIPITQVVANHHALKVACGEILRLAVERATLIKDFEVRQDPALLDIVGFNGFICEPKLDRPHRHRSYSLHLASWEQPHEARFVRITDWGLPIWLDPFGMLEPQVVVNLLPKFGVGVDFVRWGRCRGQRFTMSAG